MWAELLEPLCEDILRRLPLRDYLRFGAVCRPWYEVQQQVPPPVHQLPCFLLDSYKALDGNSGGSASGFDTTFLFCNPWKERSDIYVNVNVNLHEDEDEDEDEDGMHLAASHGWLFMGELPNIFDNGRRFFVNPFTGSRIQVPYLVFGCSQDMIYSLSAPPTNPNCVLVVPTNLITLTSYRIRDSEQKWKLHSISILGVDFAFYHDITFCNASKSFYALVRNYSLGLLDLC